MQPSAPSLPGATRAPRTSLRTAALITGLCLLGSVAAAPFAELYALPKLLVQYNAAETAKNIIAHQGLFAAVICAYFVTFFLDVVLTWSLYVLLRPVHSDLSLLTAWLRLTYSILALVALNNLVTVFRLLTVADYLTVYPPDQLYAHAMLTLRAFRNHWYFGLSFFGIHLLFVGYLIYRSTYIPRILGVILAITGLGYILTTFRPFVLPGVNIDFAKFTFYGELVFMLWLLIRGHRIKEQHPAE